MTNQDTYRREAVSRVPHAVCCKCGRVLAEQRGTELFLRWRGRKVKIKAAEAVEITCEVCGAVHELKPKTGEVRQLITPTPPSLQFGR